jgi:hypothetical protein
MFAFIMAMAPDPDGAEDFRTALGQHALNEIAICCDVPQSQVTKWTQVGNIPDCHKKNLPPDVRLRLEELRARRAGALVVKRDMLRDLLDLVCEVARPVPVSVTLASAECGALSRRGEKSVA